MRIRLAVLVATVIGLVPFGARSAEQADRHRQAADLLEKAKAAGAEVTYALDRARAYRVVARAQHNTGDAAGAHATLVNARETIGKNADHDGTVLTQAYYELADDQASLRDVAGAKATLMEASRAAGKSFSTRAAAFMYAKVAERRARIGDAAGAALDLAAAADVASGETGSSRDSALRYVAEGMASCGRFDAAEAVAAAIRTPLDRSFDRSMAYEAIAVARAAAGDVAGARKVAALTNDPRDQARAESRMARARLRAGDVAGAIAIADGITDPTERDFAYNAIATVQAAAGDVAAAKATAAKIGWASERAEALAAVAVAQARAGDAPGAHETAAAAREAAADEDVSRDRAELFARIGTALGLASDAEGGKACFAEARAAADKLDAKLTYDACVRSGLMAKIVSAQAEVGDLDAARATMEAMDGTGYDADKAEACRAIAAAEVRRGGLSTLVYWIAALPDPMCRADAYVGAAEAMVRPGRAATP